MRDWQKSSQHFIDLIKQFPNCNDAKNELTRALARLKESRAGQFDLSSLFNKFHYDEVCYFDIADYVGPVKIANIPGKGKGLIATSDIEPGTLLTVSKAFSTVIFNIFLLFVNGGRHLYSKVTLSLFFRSILPITRSI